MATLTSVKSSLFSPREYYLEDDFTMDDVLNMLIAVSQRETAYETLSDYYRGKHVIFQREFEGDKTKPNNKLAHNFAKVITDNSVSYFMGQPVKYECASSELSKKLERISEYNHEDDVDAELAKLTSMFGHAFEVLWIDDKGEIRFKQISPQHMFVCYSTSLDPELLVGVAYRKILLEDKNTTRYYLTVYKKDVVEEYTADTPSHAMQFSDLTLVSSKPHYFGEVPIIEYVNNEERLGDYECVLSLMDAYNLACSDSVNDIQYFNDAYLMIMNAMGTKEEDIRDMKNNKVMLLEDGGDAKWLIKQVNDAHIENIKTRLVDDIHKFSMTPALSDEKLVSNLSGKALGYKLYGLENKTAGKERKFKTAIQKRLRIIIGVLNKKGNNFDYLDVIPKFTRNIPQDLSDLVNAVVSLNGLVPLEQLLTILPMVDDPKQAIKDLEAEEKRRSENMYPMNSEADFDWGGEDEQADKKDTREVQDKTDNRIPRKSSKSNSDKTNKVSK